MALTAESLLADMNTLIEQYGPLRQLVIGYSGGLDSSVLLHLCRQNQARFQALGVELSAVYIDHQLQAESAQWADFCQHQCESYQIPFQSIPVNAQAEKRQSPEAAARDARYAAFRELLTQQDCLVTAHHLSDQAETLLLQMLRGSGPKGLAAMPAYKAFYHSHQFRPLLNASQAEILAYAQTERINWIDDQSNLDRRYKRNFLRHEVIPVLKQQWPALEKTLHRVTQLQAQSVEILQEVAQSDLQACRYSSSTQGDLEFFEDWQVLCLAPLQALSSARINNLVQFWLRHCQIPVLNEKLLQRLQQELIFGARDNQALIQWQANQQAFAMRRYQDFLIIESEIEFDSDRIFGLPIDDGESLDLQFGTIQVEAEINHLQSVRPPAAISRSKLGERVEIRFRQGGEKFALSEATHHSLKKWLQEQQIPYWLRDKIPLVYSGERLVQVGQHLVDKSYAARSQEDSLFITWNYRTCKADIGHKVLD